MSDTPQGPGWWQASDGRYYPPESAPGAAAPSDSPGYAPPNPAQAGWSGAQPGQPYSQAGPSGAPQWTPPPQGQKKEGMPGWLIALIVVAVLGVLLIGGCIAAVAVVGRSASSVIEEVSEAIDELNAFDDSSCAFVELDDGSVGAEVTVTNTTDARSDYEFRIGDNSVNGVDDTFEAGVPFSIDGVDVNETRTERTGPLPFDGAGEGDLGSCKLVFATRSTS